VPRGTKSKERVPENLPASVHGVPAPIVFFFIFLLLPIFFLSIAVSEKDSSGVIVYFRCWILWDLLGAPKFAEQLNEAMSIHVRK
jgi:hypothetical protein